MESAARFSEALSARSSHRHPHAKASRCQEVLVHECLRAEHEADGEHERHRRREGGGRSARPRHATRMPPPPPDANGQTQTRS